MKKHMLSAILVAWIVLTSSVAYAQAFPYTPGIKESITDVNTPLWTQAQVDAHITTTVADPGGDDIPTRDNAALVGDLGHSSNTVETINFREEELDLTQVTEPLKISILVDDFATLKVTSNDFDKPYEVEGSALWRSVSKKTFDTVLSPGKKYKLNLTYKNKFNLNGKPGYENKKDVDGVNIYLSKVNVGEWYKEERNIIASRKIGEFIDGSGDVKVYIKYSVCWETKKLANNKFRYRKLKWVLNDRPENQTIAKDFNYTDGGGAPILFAKDSTWSIDLIGPTTDPGNDKMEIADSVAGTKTTGNWGNLNAAAGGGPLPAGISNTKEGINWTSNRLPAVTEARVSVQIDQEGDSLNFIDSGHTIQYRVTNPTGENRSLITFVSGKTIKLP